MFDGVRPIMRFASAPTAGGGRLHVDGDHRRLVQDDAAAADVDKGVAVPRSTAMSRPSR